ncbi:DUF2336 domain-containing protein [Parvibaculum sp.]|uniref:DUF2336 domain-containing protein n=1 Tax=Parvibaculum sp. TaxID=2024848 RepID=UPI003BAB1DF4
MEADKTSRTDEMALESYRSAEDEALSMRAKNVQAGDALLRRLADLALLPASLISPQERSILDSMLATLAARLDPQMRVRLAERLSQHVEAPRELALALALDDDIEIARPLLSEGQTLKGGDLIHVAREGSAAHREMLAARKDLPSAVADVLIEMGDTALASRVLENMTAQLSYRAIETLARRSAAEPELQAPVLARPELTVRLGQFMFWWVAADLRLEILNRFTVERRHIHSAMEDVLKAAGTGDAVLDAALSQVRKPLPVDKQRLAGFLSGKGPDRAELLAGGLAAEAHVRPETMFRILNDHGGEPLAVFAKAVSMNRKEFGDLIVAAVDLRRGGLPTKKDLERIGELFDTISTDRADLALRAWDAALANEVLPAGIGAAGA